jgi:hypothetical protein
VRGRHGVGVCELPGCLVFWSVFRILAVCMHTAWALSMRMYFPTRRLAASCSSLYVFGIDL